MSGRHGLIATRDSLRGLLLIPGLVALGAVAVAVMLLSGIEYLSGRTGGALVLAATVGGGCAIAALVVVEITNLRLTRTAGTDSARLHAMMAAMKDGVCCVDQGGRLTYMNPAAENMLGRTFEEYAGASLTTVFALEHRQGSHNNTALFTGMLGKESSYIGRDSVITAAGAILPVDVRVEPIMLQRQRAGAVIVFADDTERSRDEQAKDDFVGFASHELRSPLTAVHGFSSWLAKKLEREPWRFDAGTSEAIAALASETGRMESIIELFLDLTQIRMDRISLESDLVDVTKLLREEAASVRSRYPAATVEELLPASRVLAILDEQRLRQVILNLLDNAAKYGGSKPHIVLALATADDTAELRISDSGSGIPREDQRYIFERFFRSEAPATGHMKGFGIGLFVTKQIVDRMGGELGFTSEEGRGTEFTLRLPLKLDGVPDAESAPEKEAVTAAV